MTHYVILGKWTEQGIKNVKDAPKRIDETHKAIEYRGGKMKTPPMPPGGL